MARDGRDRRPPAGRGRGEQLPVWLLRAGLAFVFLYAGAASFRHPTTFARYFPSFLPSRLTSDLVPLFAVFELLLAVSLLTPRFTYVASLLAAATLAGIVVANLDAFEVLFRNVAIACAALALALQHRPPRSPEDDGAGVEASVDAGTVTRAGPPR